MEFSGYVRFVLALVFVIGLIGLLAVIARRYGLGIAAPRPGKGRKRRLQLVEIMPIDAKRRAVLFRRDETEHLVIIGAGSETVVETGITPPDDIADDDGNDVDGGFGGVLRNEMKNPGDSAG